MMLTMIAQTIPDRVMITFWPTQSVFRVVLASYPINSENTQKKLLFT